MEFETRKLYVGGLLPTAQQDELKEHFGRYGEVLCVRVVRDRETGQGRGFAFVEFADDEGARGALDEKEKASHVFGGRTVDVKRARVRPMRDQIDRSFLHYTNQSPVHSQWYNQSSSNNSHSGNGNRSCDPNKVFVGGLRGNITKEDLRSYFEKFGTIIDVVVIRDGATFKSRGFGFITFDSEEAMQKVLENTYHDLNGTKVETKIAIPKDRHYYQDRRHYSPVTWGGSSPAIGYGGMYPPQNLQYIFNNHYMVPVPQYMYSPQANGDYGYMMNGSSNSNVPAMIPRQAAPVMYADSGTPYGYDYAGRNGAGIYSVDAGSYSKTNQVMTNQQQVNIPDTIPDTITTKEEPANSESDNLS